MASIQRRPDGSWRARFRDRSDHEHARHFARKIDAQRWLDEMTSQLLTGAYVDPRAGRLTLAEYVETRWLPAQVHLRPSTLELYRAHLRNHVLPMFGARALGSLRRPDMKAFVAVLASRLAPATAQTAYAVLRSVMQSAVDDDLVVANPCSRVPLPRVEPRVVEALAPSAVLALAESITMRYGVAVWLGAGLGLREGEALGLLVGRVDFLGRRVHIEEQLVGNGETPRLAPLKTRASRRVVPADDLVLEAVSEHIRRRSADPHGLLIVNRLGRPVRRSSFGDRWRAAVLTAGLPPGTRFHDLRHFYASTLIGAGVHPKTIQVRLGHATITETMDTYGHLFPDSEDHGRGAFDAALRRRSLQDRADFSRT